MFSRTKKDSHPFGWLSFLFASAELVLCSPGYETDERSSLGHEPDRRRWREEGGRSECRGLYFQGGFDRRRKYRAPQTGRYAEPFLVNVRHKDNKSSPASATNNANRFRYRRKKSSNHNGYWIFLSHFFKWNSIDILSQKRLSGRTWTKFNRYKGQILRLIS